MSGLRTLTLLFAITILLVVPAEATTSYYAGGTSAENAFNSDPNLGTLTLLNPAMTFSSSDLASGGLYNASGTSIDFLGFNDSNVSENFTVSSGKLTASQPAEQATITFPAGGVFAFGVHISVVSSFGLWCVELTHGACDYSLTNSSNSAANVQFFGIVSTTPITAPLYIRPSAFSPQLVLPSFEAFTKVEIVSPAPEPDTLLLAGLGLVILRLARRRVPRGR